ncbi:Hypothetical protein SRAE_2000059800 [Strongyloides ratti]|uniref:Uncharacterized protein n=1 Tax=Strongyloides ratti TaxID=34506 RepID=A0A090MXS1_STRRB|nr:Hypothetical protein SRAE_2000059800 [Strongyloides ratti]CEF65924.1 Hypothetical protein SRAE_2000059800 [Strongyloides ratti]
MDENIDKKSMFRKILFPQLSVSPDEIEIFGFNKNHTTIYDKQYNMYEVTFNFTKISSPVCKNLLEIFIVTINKKGKIILELYGGIIELNQDKFINNKVTIYMKTKNLYYVDDICNNFNNNNDECYPIGKAVKVTFMSRNDNTCDNFNLKSVKIKTLFKKTPTDVTYIENENEIIFGNSENIKYANTYAIYTSNIGTPVCLNITRPWKSEYKKNEMFLLDPTDDKFPNANKKCLKSIINFILFFIFIILGSIETIVVIIVIHNGRKKLKKSEINNNKLFNGKKFSTQDKLGYQVEKKESKIEVVNEEKSNDEEKISSIDKNENVGEKDYKKNIISNNINNKKQVSKENEKDNYDVEDYEDNEDDNNDEDVESNAGKGGDSKNQKKGAKKVPLKGIKNVRKKTSQQPKKKVVCGKKGISKNNGKKSTAFKKETPKKTAIRRQKPKPAANGRRK